MNDNKKWERNCPKCNDKLIYKHRGSYYRAVKENAKCKECHKTDYCYSNEEFLSKCKKVHGSKYSYDLDFYKKWNEKIKIKCNTCGFIFLQIPNSHLNGRGCPNCKRNKISNLCRSNTKEFIETAIMIHGTKYDYSLVDYKTNRHKVKIICKIHGEFLQTPNCHISRKRKRGCPKCGLIKCGLAKRGDINIFIKQAKKIHGSKYDYSGVDYKYSNIKVKIKCNKCNRIFYQTPNSHLCGRGCSKCGSIISSQKQTLTITEFIKKANKIHKNKYDYSNVLYVNNHSKIKILCKLHGIFNQVPSSHLCGNGCPKCVHIISKPEIKFLDYLKIPDTYQNRQMKILRKKVDGYDPQTNTIYEFLGDYWHGNPNIFNPNDIHPRIKKTYGQVYENTMNRFNKFKALGYNIKYIWESDWKRFEKGHSLNLQTV